MKKEALELSLKYSFVTPLTSMVVTKPLGEKTDVLHKPKEGGTTQGHSTGVPFPPPVQHPMSKYFVLAVALIRWVLSNMSLSEVLTPQWRKREGRKATETQESRRTAE